MKNLHSTQTQKVKPILLSLLLFSYVILLILYPKTSINAAKNALQVWFSGIIPSLFPFSVASYLLLQTGVFRILGKIFEKPAKFLFALPGSFIGIFLCALFSSYPTGAKMTAALHQIGELSEKDAERILLFSSLCGTGFLSGTVAIGFLSDASLAPALIFGNTLPPLIFAVISGLFHKKDKASAIIKKTFSAEIPFSKLLSEAISSSAMSMLQIGGSMLVLKSFAAVLGEIFPHFLHSPVGLVFLGMLEMTTGCEAIANSTLSLHTKAVTASFFCGFSGLSIILQTKNAAFPIKTKCLLPYKGLQAILQAFLTHLFLKYSSASECLYIPSGIGIGLSLTAGILFFSFLLSALRLLQVLVQAYRSVFPCFRGRSQDIR